MTEHGQTTINGQRHYFELQPTADSEGWYAEIPGKCSGVGITRKMAIEDLEKKFILKNKSRVLTL